MTQSAHGVAHGVPTPLGNLGNPHAMTQMTQRPVALVLERAPSPWCSSARTASHAMTQMTQRPRVARTGARARALQAGAAG
jgi:hypothetical protein